MDWMAWTWPTAAFFATIAAEMGMKQVNHGPKVAAFLHVDLEQISQVIQRRGGLAQHTLLFDRCRLRITLGHNQPPEGRTVFPGYILPHRVALMIAKSDFPVWHWLVQENAPSVFWHFDVIKICPAIGVYVHCRPQIDVITLCAFRAEFVPPAQVIRQPGFQRPLQPPVLAEIDVVRNALVVVNRQHILVLCSIKS